MENFISCAVSKMLIFHFVKLNYKTLSICILETVQAFQVFQKLFEKKYLVTIKLSKCPP